MSNEIAQENLNYSSLMTEYHTTIKMYEKTNKKINKKQNPIYSMITNYLYK